MKDEYQAPVVVVVSFLTELSFCQVSGDGNVDSLSEEDWGVL